MTTTPTAQVNTPEPEETAVKESTLAEESTTEAPASQMIPAHPFARIDEAGTVYVRDGDEERSEERR